MAHFADQLGAWIEILVDAVPKAHQLEMAGLVLGHVQVLGNIAGIADLLQHGQHRFVGPTVCRPPQRGNAR